MTISRGSLRAFLATAKTRLHNAVVNQQKVTIIIGNESCDLDSMTSAVLLAYIRSNATITSMTSSSDNNRATSSHNPPIYIPVLNIPRADVKIRPEFLALLPYANIEPSHLITLDDLTVPAPTRLETAGIEKLQPQNTRVILVDHNNLAGPLGEEGFRDSVVGVIDHHVDEKAVPPDTGNEPRIIQKCGSCTSLVTRYCREAWDSISGTASAAGRATSGQSDASVGVDDDAVRRTWDAQIARFAIASILIDTKNLTDAYQTTDIDRKCVDYLESKIFLAPGGVGAKWDRDAFYNEINTAKEDMSRLDPDEILRKDYKQYLNNGKHLGIASAVKSLAWQVDHAKGVEKFRRTMKHFAEERELDLLAIMTKSTKDDVFRRELLVWSLSSKNDAIVEAFENEAGEDLKLEEWHDVEGLDAEISGTGKLKIWWQKDTDKSRKQVAPLLRAAIDKS